MSLGVLPVDDRAELEQGRARWLKVTEEEGEHRGAVLTASRNRSTVAGFR
jgi:hypothetical protein